MSTLAPLIERERADAAVAWLATFALAAAGWQLLADGAAQWAALAALLVAVAAVPPLATRDPAVTMPGELVVLIAVPVVARAAGLFVQATPFLAVAGLALLAAVALDAFTSLEMTPRFAVAFVVVTTMAFAGAWAVGEWAADSLLGTAYLTDLNELMWDLAVATAMGLLAAGVFEAYFAFSGRIRRLRATHGERASRRLSPTERSHDAAPVQRATTAPEDAAADLFGGWTRHRTAVRAMQVLLAGIVALALVRADGKLFANSAVPLAATFLPGLLRREYGYPMDAGLALWVTAAVTLHAVGAVGPYETIPWWDNLTHALSATLVAAVGYAVARAVELHTDDVSFSPRFRAAFVVLFVLAVGVAWELFEFGLGGLAVHLGGEALLSQYSLENTVHDLVFDAVGAAVVAVWGSGHLEGVARALVGRVDVLADRD